MFYIMEYGRMKIVDLDHVDADRGTAVVKTGPQFKEVSLCELNYKRPDYDDKTILSGNDNMVDSADIIGGLDC